MTDEKVVNTGGRPTKLNDDVILKTTHYIENHQDYGDVVPTVEGLAYELHVNKSTLYRWAEDNEAFCNVFDRLKMAQGKKLLNGGLTSDLNATITKLMLTKHDYSDKQGVDVTSGGEQIAVPSVFMYEVLADENQDT